jgi:hypothetical protein
MPFGLNRQPRLSFIMPTPNVEALLGNAWGVLTYKQRGQDKTLITELQMKQNLKP